MFYLKPLHQVFYKAPRESYEDIIYISNEDSLLSFYANNTVDRTFVVKYEKVHHILSVNDDGLVGKTVHITKAGRVNNILSKFNTVRLAAWIYENGCHLSY